MTDQSSRRQAIGVAAASAAGSAAFLAAGTGRAAAVPTRRTGPVYTIAKPRERLLTLERWDGPAVLLRAAGEPGQQEWELLSVPDGTVPDGTVFLRNVGEGTYLGYEGAPHVNKLIAGRPHPVGWELRAGAEPDTYHVVAPGGLVDGAELALDLGLLLVYPPRMSLRPLRLGDERQAWLFTLEE
ncbi:hypothetical protein E6W39_28695 [Kitasatospora acidiphila]|uniref:Uncharacterized protein n=1 Tax=Kitasatospora acidiphila TaxID=2567942 RepID=A0A540W8Z2_9ACTN|nr:hypothetical protein [Kitasatospora acidiphila]TQF05486.1 hypothetical protein E6W39_28695 [Kitasatospora acidiphila]